MGAAELREGLDEAVALYEAGVHGTELAKRYGVEHGSIYRALRERGVKIRPRGGGAKQPRMLAPQTEHEIVDRYKSDPAATLTQVASEFGVSRATINRTLLRHNIPRHPRGQRRSQVPPRDRVPGTQPQTTASGYLQVWLPRGHRFASMCQARGWVMQHRLVMAEHLDRPLLRTETVHHRNGDRQDNRLKNLELRQGRHGNGQGWRCQACGSLDVVAV